MVPLEDGGFVLHRRDNLSQGEGQSPSCSTREILGSLTLKTQICFSYTQKTFVLVKLNLF